MSFFLLGNKVLNALNYLAELFNRYQMLLAILDGKKLIDLTKQFLSREYTNIYLSSLVFLYPRATQKSFLFFLK